MRPICNKQTISEEVIPENHRQADQGTKIISIMGKEKIEGDKLARMGMVDLQVVYKSLKEI